MVTCWTTNTQTKQWSWLTNTRTFKSIWSWFNADTIIFKQGFCHFQILHQRLTSFFMYPPELEKHSWNLNNGITNTHTHTYKPLRTTRWHFIAMHVNTHVAVHKQKLYIRQSHTDYYSMISNLKAPNSAQTVFLLFRLVSCHNPFLHLSTVTKQHTQQQLKLEGKNDSNKSKTILP